MGGAADDVPQLAAADHLLDRVAAVRAGGALHPQRVPRERALLRGADARDEPAGVRDGVLAGVGQGAPRVWVPHSA